jgi:hypothetical protein
MLELQWGTDPILSFPNRERVGYMAQKPLTPPLNGYCFVAATQQQNTTVLFAKWEFGIKPVVDFPPNGY